MAVYTHTFKLKFDGQDIQGEVEFNVDGITSYKTNEPIEGVTVAASNYMNRLFEVAANLYRHFGDIDEIEITKKN